MSNLGGYICNMCIKHLAILILIAGCLVAYSQSQDRARKENKESATDHHLAAVNAERICLIEVLISASEADSLARVNDARHKAERVRKAVLTGGAFSDLSRANSQGPWAAQGGATGLF